MFDHDRTLPPFTAWRSGLTLLSDLGLTLQQPDPVLSSSATSYVVPTKIFLGDRCISEACGKGIDWQAWASGLYEALEHAASEYKLPGQSPLYSSRALPKSALEDRDLVYRFARRIRGDSAQPVVEFEDPVTHRPVLYPAIAADFGFAITADDRDLGYLDRVSTTKGYASGSDRREAEIHALNELIEHDALSAYLLSHFTQADAPVELDVMSWPPAIGVIRTLQNLGARELVIVRLPSLVSTVVFAWCMSADGAVVTGIGCSSFVTGAVMRALTETHQELVAERLGASWVSEGGEHRDNLAEYPVLHSLAVPPRPTPRFSVTIDAVRAREDSEIDPHPGSQLAAAGFFYLSREVWSSPTLSVVQVLIPGAERFADIDLGRPIIPTGRLATANLTAQLLRKKGKWL